MDTLPILSMITYSPLAGALILFFVPSIAPEMARRVAIAAGLVSFILSLAMLMAFDVNDPTMQFTEHIGWLPGVGVNYDFGVDGISAVLVVLTTLLGLIGIIASTSITRRRREYYISLLLLQTGMIGVFFALDLFLFYIFWELMLVPMALLIGVWGSANRVYAAVKFFLYTLAGSLLMLVGIVAVYWENINLGNDPTLNILDLASVQYSDSLQFWVFLAFFIAFAIKVPMWPFHTWLPDAHVEAPTIGSVLLAGVLLKMGGYGLIRFNLSLTPDAAQDLAPYIMALSLVGIIYGALVALVQPDMKKLVAYSSVSHMGFVTLGIFAFNMQGMYGAMIVMLSHGFVTGGLFLCVGVVYERAHTRLISAFGGIVSRMPIYSALFGVFMLASLGLPGLSGFVGEFLALVGAFNAYRWAGVIGMVVVILAAWYMMWMFQRVVLGRAAGEPADPHDNALPAVTGASGAAGAHHDEWPVDEHGVPQWPDVTRIELLTLLPLVLLTIIVGVWPGPFMDILRTTLEGILVQFGSQGV
ncbi:MAG: NADH-quinone oxidoreductase subunit M [Thermomicrobiales bacterium]